MGGEIRNPKSEGGSGAGARGGPLLIRRHSWFQNQSSFSARPGFKALALGFGFRISDFPLPPEFSLNLVALQRALPCALFSSRTMPYRGRRVFWNYPFAKTGRERHKFKF